MPPGIPQSFPGKDFPVPQGQLGMTSTSMEPMAQPPPPPFKEMPVPEAQVYDEPEMQAKPGLFTNERGNLKVRTFCKSSISLWSAGTRSVTRVGARRRASAGTRVALERASRETSAAFRRSRSVITHADCGAGALVARPSPSPGCR